MGLFGPKEGEAKSKDPVCGQVVVEALAVGPEESAAGAVWFCSLGCQAQYQAEAERPSKGSPPEPEKEVEA